MPNWIWKVRSYKDGELMLETVHASDVSKDMEVKAAEACGRTVVVIDLRDQD